jgi:diguanylate cyclase (GGDEF)-like protein
MIARANALREAVGRLEIPYADGVLPVISISGGVASLSDGFTQVDDLLKAADLALYRAKAEGRNRVISARDLPRGVAAE